MRSMATLLALRLTGAGCCKLRSDGTRYALAFLADTRTFEDSNRCLPLKATRLLRRPSGTLFCAPHWCPPPGHVTCNVTSYRSRSTATGRNGDAGPPAIERAHASVARARARRRQGLRDGAALRGVGGFEATMDGVPRADAHTRQDPRE